MILNEWPLVEMMILKYLKGEEKRKKVASITFELS